MLASHAQKDVWSQHSLGGDIGGRRSLQGCLPKKFDRPASAPVYTSSQKPSNRSWEPASYAIKSGVRRNSTRTSPFTTASNTASKYSKPKPAWQSTSIHPASVKKQNNFHNWNDKKAMKDAFNQQSKKRYDSNFKKTDIRFSRKEPFPALGETLIGGLSTLNGIFGKTIHIANLPSPKKSIGHPKTAASNLNFGAETARLKRERQAKLEVRHYAPIVKKEHRIYSTSNHKYGERAPHAVENTEEYFGLSTQFTNDYPHPMWRNNSLVTTTKQPYVVQ